MDGPGGQPLVFRYFRMQLSHLATYGDARGIKYSKAALLSSHSCITCSLRIMSKLDATLGAIELGGLLSIFMFGLFNLQGFRYYRNYPNDSWVLKSMVSCVDRLAC